MLYLGFSFSWQFNLLFVLLAVLFTYFYPATLLSSKHKELSPAVFFKCPSILVIIQSVCMFNF